MFSLQRFKDRIDGLHGLQWRDAELKTNIKIVNDRIAKLESKIKSGQELIENSNKAIVLLTNASVTARNNAKNHFERIITDALQFVTQSRDYRFVIQEKNSKTKAAYEFFVESTVNGVKCLQKPEDANGGGFIDIISVAAKFAYLEIFNDPKIKSATILCDEPGKMISAEMSIKFAEYLKFLGKHYGRQIIMITHNDSLTNVATKTFSVVKDNNGVSKVMDITDNAIINIDDIFDNSDISNLLSGGI